jgi:hypothetical protein
MNPDKDSIYPRAGVNHFPLINTEISTLGMQMPVYDPAFNLSFSEVTDRRFQQLWTNRQDKKWLVLWSGGIDSTVMLASLLKNLSAEDRSNIVVACNRVSVYEYPAFFYKYIQPNFEIVDSTNFRLNSTLLTNYHIFAGDPADMLYGAHFTRNFIDGDFILRDWRNDPDDLIKFMGTSAGQGAANWYYELIKENIDSTNIPVDTYYDFFWWLNFNNMWATLLMRPLTLYQTENTNSSVDLYFNNFVDWYNNDEYQQWSLNTRQGVKYNVSIGERKLASKKYIFDFDHNQHYFKFKLKAESISRVLPQKDRKKDWFCLLDDYSRLTLDDNLSTILELLPNHINK